MSGIFRDVYVLSHPRKRLLNYRIKTVLSEDRDSSELLFTPFGHGAECILTDDAGTIIAEFSACDGKTESVHIDSPLLWSAEKPDLYNLDICAGEERIGERVGFRDISAKNGILKVNGIPLKFKGVNRHDSYPDTGFYASRTQMIKDIILMKKHNINAVHTSF